MRIISLMTLCLALIAGCSSDDKGSTDQDVSKGEKGGKEGSTSNNSAKSARGGSDESGDSDGKPGSSKSGGQGGSDGSSDKPRADSGAANEEDGDAGTGADSG